MQITDNLLDEKSFIELQKFVMSSEINWRFAPGSVYQNDGHEQFFHPLYIAPTRSDTFDRVCMPVVTKLEGFVTLLRAKMNMTLKRDRVTKKVMHIDMESAKQYYDVMKTSIFYCTTTDAPTFFEDGRQVDCVANRLVTFPMGTKHCGSYATDAQQRIAINLNWF